MLARVIAGPDPEVPASLLDRGAPGDRRRRRGARWLTRSGCCATPRPSGRGRAAHRAHRHPAHRRGARAGARAARAPRRPGPSPSCSARPLSRARETAQLAGLECSELRDDLLEWDYGDYEGDHDRGDPRDAARLVPVARRRRPAARRPTTSAARVDRVIAEVRAVEGDVARRRPRPHPARAGGALGRAPVDVRRAPAPRDRRGLRAGLRARGRRRSAAGTRSNRTTKQRNLRKSTRNRRAYQAKEIVGRKAEYDYVGGSS